MAEQQARTSAGANSYTVLQEERYLWMARAFVVMLVLAVICDLILLIALSNVTPVMRVQPFYLETQNKEQQIVSVTRPSAETLNSDALKESLVRQYVLSRYGIKSDLTELEERWGGDGPVFWMSDQSVYDEFKKNEFEKLFPLAQQDNFTRNPVILKINKTNAGNNAGRDVWRVELKLEDSNRTSVNLQTRKYIADVVTVFRPVQRGMTWKDRLKNPLGFTVVGFGLHEDKEKTQK